MTTWSLESGRSPRCARPAEIVTPDGFARYVYAGSRETARRRFYATKEFLRAGGEVSLQLAIGSLHCGALCGALWKRFGPPHDVLDDWKQSFQFCLDVLVTPAIRDPDGGRTPVELLLDISDWKGSAQMRLRMPVHGRSTESLEDGEDLLRYEERLEVLAYFFGFCKGFIESSHLEDFDRRLPDGMPYGVENGVPFPQPWPD